MDAESVAGFEGQDRDHTSHQTAPSRSRPERNPAAQILFNCPPGSGGVVQNKRTTGCYRVPGSRPGSRGPGAVSLAKAHALERLT